MITSLAIECNVYCNVYWTKLLNTDYKYLLKDNQIGIFIVKEGSVLFNNTLNTFIYGYTALDIW